MGRTRAATLMLALGAVIGLLVAPGRGVASPPSVAEAPPIAPSAGPGAVTYVDPSALPTIGSSAIGGRCVVASGVRASSMPWHQQMLRPDAAWPVSQGSGVTVAVVDTGVAAAGVTALAGRVDDALATLPGPAPGTDCVGHGTFVAGLIAGAVQNGSFFTGVAPLARVLPIRAATEAGGASAAALAAAVRLATDAHARVILVTPGVFVPDPGLHDAVRYAIAHGCLVVAPAALDGQTRPGIAYPAGFSETLSVAGIGPTGAPPSDQPAGAPVDVVAPSVGVVSVGPGGDGNFLVVLC